MHRHCSPWTAHPPQAAPGGVAKRSIAGTGATLVRVEVPAGTAAGRHSHPHEQFVQVLSGSGTLETEDGTVRFEAGSVFHFPEGTWHRAEFETETVLVETNVGVRCNERSAGDRHPEFTEDLVG